MELRPDQWLSEVLGRAVFSLVDLDDPSLDRAVTFVDDHARRNGPAMYDAKFAADRVDIARALGAAGFFTVDVNVTFAIDGRSPLPALDPVPSVNVRRAAEDDQAAVLDLAGTAFRYSRFHLDPLIDRSAADRVKREWIRSYFEGRRGEALWVAVRDGVVTGFVAVLDGRDGGTRVRTIDLIGVTPSAQRQGVGTALVAAFISNYRETSGRLEVGTQVANTPSIALYERCGFTIRRARSVMHAHLGRTA